MRQKTSMSADKASGGSWEDEKYDIGGDEKYDIGGDEEYDIGW